MYLGDFPTKGGLKKISFGIAADFEDYITQSTKLKSLQITREYFNYMKGITIKKYQIVEK